MTRRQIFTFLISLLSIAAVIFLHRGSDSISGLDVDHNGVRDDVDQFIEKTYPNSEKTRAAARQMAKALQQAIEHPEIGTGLRNHYDHHKDLLGAATACLFSVLPDQADEVGKQVESAVVNTKPRVKAYIKFNGNASGGIYPSWDEKQNGNPCSFDPHAMKN